MATYTYLVMRKSTLRANATCKHVKATLCFWNWFYFDQDVMDFITTVGFEPLPVEMRERLVSRLNADVKCHGVPAYNPDFCSTDAASSSRKRLVEVYVLSALTGSALLCLLGYVTHSGRCSNSADLNSRVDSVPTAEAMELELPEAAPIGHGAAGAM